RLRATGNRVIALTRQPRAAMAGEHVVTSDVLEPASLTAIDAATDYIVYLVSPDQPNDEGYRAAYVDAIRNVLEYSALRQTSLKRVLFASSTAVYGQSDGSWVDETSPTEPTSFHGQRLLEAERLLGAWVLPHSVVRFGGIYGPGRQRLLTSVIDGTASVAREPVYTNRIHRDDCAGLLVHLMSLQSADSLYLGVDHERADRRAVLEWLARATQSRPPAVKDDPEQRRQGNKRCSNSRVLATGYRFAYPSFREGYAEMIDRLGHGSRASP